MIDLFPMNPETADRDSALADRRGL